MKNIFNLWLILIITIVTLSFQSCTKQSIPCGIADPTCLNDIIANHEKNGLISIKTQQVRGDDHYYLETGASTWDGVEYIVNSMCDTVCNFGGKRMDGWPDCYKDYNFENWKTYWKR